MKVRISSHCFIHARSPKKSFHCIRWIHWIHCVEEPSKTPLLTFFAHQNFGNTPITCAQLCSVTQCAWGSDLSGTQPTNFRLFTFVAALGSGGANPILTSLLSLHPIRFLRSDLLLTLNPLSLPASCRILNLSNLPLSILQYFALLTCEVWKSA